tara:strand:+ start:4291 stop:4875 length:585 start_codon:yes stop_codon:yes gene_type:complete
LNFGGKCILGDCGNSIPKQVNSTITIPYDTMKRAATLVECGMIPAAVSRELGISASSVKKAVKEFGVVVSAPKLGRKRKFPLDLVKLAQRMKRKGMFSSEIAVFIGETTEYEVTKRQVAYMTKDVKRLKREDIKDKKVLVLKNKRVTRNASRNLEICTTYRNGESLSEVAQKFGLTRERVRQILIQNKVARRPG